MFESTDDTTAITTMTNLNDVTLTAGRVNKIAATTGIFETGNSFHVIIHGHGDITTENTDHFVHTSVADRRRWRATSNGYSSPRS